MACPLFQSPRRQCRLRAGFSLPEMMAAVVIVAILMAALAVAVQGTMHAYSQNAEIAQVNQASRVVLNRMMAELRTAKETSGAGTFLSILPADNADGTTEIQYELVNGALVRRQIGGAAANVVNLIDASEQVKVTTFNVSRNVATDGGGATYTASVTVTLGIQVANNSMQTTASAALRKNMTY
jgi:prepilin-type N-terminal cleavage/methylation domain-containing protein